MTYWGLGYVGRAGAKLVSSCKDLYNDLNGANLTGAVDVIGIKQPDGSIKATPFHVRFGKFGVFRTGDLKKEVEIEVNGEVVNNKMMITENGSAFFVKSNPAEGSSRPTSQCLDHSLSVDTTVSVSSSDCVTPVPSSSPIAPLDLLLVQDAKIDNEGATELLLSTTDHHHHHHQADVSIEESDVDTSPEKSKEDIFEDKEPLLIGVSTPSIAIPQPSEPANSDFETPTGDIANLKWPEPKLLSSSLPDSGVLSDSALEETNDKYQTSEVNLVLSDSEVDRYKVKTQGDVTRSLSTAEEGGLASLQNEDQRGIWGKLTGILRKKKRRRYSSIEEGVYLDDLSQGFVDQEEVLKFFPDRHPHTPHHTSPIFSDGTSGVGSSPSLSPSHPPASDEDQETDKILNTLSDIAISRCGGLSQGRISNEMFQSSQISFAEFCSNPEILAHPDTVVRINNKYYGWQVAAPMIMSCLLYSQTLPESSMTALLKSKKSRFWSFWNRNNSSEPAPNENNMPSSHEVPIDHHQPIDQPIDWASSPHVIDSPSSDEGGPTDEETSTNSKNEGTSKSRQRSMRRKKLRFSTELTPEELAQWPLKMGRNDIVFSITTKYQGTAKAACTFYLWDCTVKLVISDFDGTITRSDVAGQVLPLIGKDWTQNGVIELFSAINKNGYHFVYLSARAIGQSWYTKNYLRNTKRGDYYFPDGPLLVTPFSLYTAFKKEVIQRIPEEFKISCLQQIQEIFPKNYNPFHSGFGNRHSDVKSYLQVNIPISRIFSVNHKGEITNELSYTFQSSYKDLMSLVDAQFPPLVNSSDRTKEGSKRTSMSRMLSEDYSSYVYWKKSLNSFDEVDLPPLV